MLLCVQPDGNCCQSLLVLVTWQAPGPSTLPHKVLARARPRVTTCAARICSCQAPGRGWLAAVLTQVPVPGVASRRELAGCYHLRESERETSSSQQPAAAPHHPNLHFPPRKDRTAEQATMGSWEGEWCREQLHRTASSAWSYGPATTMHHFAQVRIWEG